MSLRDTVQGLSHMYTFYGASLLELSRLKVAEIEASWIMVFY